MKANILFPRSAGYRGWLSIYQLTATRAADDGSACHPLTCDHVYAGARNEENMRFTPQDAS